MFHTLQKILPVNIIQTSNAPIEYSGGDVYFRVKQNRSQLGDIERDNRTRHDDDRESHSRRVQQGH